MSTVKAFSFEPATRSKAKARIALAGPSGSGKTMTSLIIASTLSDTVAVIDTERGSASKYAPPPARMQHPGPGEFIFERLDLHSYDPRDLPVALAAAAEREFGAVLVDSMSKFWSGAEGMLEQVDRAARRGYNGNSFGGWKDARPMETAMIESLLSYPGHVIVTMRTKTHYDVIEDDRGRKVPTKIGMKPEQREGIEYEFDIVGDMDMQNVLTIAKSRCPELTGQAYQRPGPPVAEIIQAWLSDGKPVLSAIDYRDMALRPGVTFAEIRGWYLDAEREGILGATFMDNTGEPVTLKGFLYAKGREKQREDAAMASAAVAGDLGGQMAETAAAS